MAQQTSGSTIRELGPGNVDPGLSGQEKQPPVTVKKIPLRDLHSENNIVAQKGSDNPLVLKEVVTTEVTKVSGTKRPSTESSMTSSHQHSPSGNGANGHLVYVRRKSEAETGKSSNSEVIADNTSSPQRQLGHQEDSHQPTSLIKGSQIQCSPAYAPIPSASLTSVPSGQPSIPASLGNLKNQTVSEELRSQPVPSATNLSVQPRVNKQKWEERYLQLQMFLKTLDQSSLEDHLQMLRSLSAVELSRHAVQLEKRAIQLSLEQGKELQRVKALNVLGKSLKTSNRPLGQQQPSEK